MGLAIDGNVVHGIARGGQAFLNVENTNADGSLNIDGQDYLNVNKIKLKKPDYVNLGIQDNEPSATIDVTSKLSNYGGHWAVCEISILWSYGSGVDYNTYVESQAFIIPTATATENLSFDNSEWSGSLSRGTDNSFKLTVSTTHKVGGAPIMEGANSGFYILNN